jgi:hypothetical protein
MRLSPQKLIPFIIILSGILTSCIAAPQSTPGAPLQTAVADVIAPSPTSVEPTPESFSSDNLGLCFSYPPGYTQIPSNDTVEIVAPELPDTDLRGLFWFEISDSYDRTAEEIADQELTSAGGLSVDRWTVTLDGEQALVLDGMPGQDLVRKVYVVHEKTLYILSFSPTLSENTAANDQMETLYTAVTNSWVWSPCSADN